MVEKKMPQKNDVPELFKDSFFVGEKQAARRAFAFPLALITHLAILGALVVLPLISTSTDLPRVEITSAFLAPPPPL